MSRETTAVWLEAHPWTGSARFCAVVTSLFALYVWTNGLSAVAALAGAIPAWVAGTIVMAKSLQRSAERRRARLPECDAGCGHNGQSGTHA